MDDIASSSPNGKSPDDPFLFSERGRLAAQLKARADQLTVDQAAPSTKSISQREVNAEFAAQAHVSVGLVEQARRLARSGHEGLIVAALLDLLPIGTALRGAMPPKPNAKYARWRRIAALAGGVQ